MINTAIKGWETAAEGIQLAQLPEAVKQAADRRVAALTGELDGIFTEMDNIQQTVWKAGLTETEEETVRLRYMERMKLKQVATTMGYSERMIIRLAEQAEEKVGKVLEATR